MSYLNLLPRNLKITCYIFVVSCIIIVIIYWTSDIEKQQLIEINTVENWNFAPIKPLKPLQYDYQQKLFDIDLNYTISTYSCDGDKELLALIIVTSYFGNVETRSAMRRAFSTSDLIKYKFRRVFLLGQAPSDQYTSQSAVVSEGNRFQDIIQGNFLEAYRNLTYKHVMGLKWASENCYKAKYIIKMDDDTVIDVPRIVNVIRSTAFPKNLIAGKILKALDSLFITLMSCVSAHLEILQGAFRTLRPRCLRRLGLNPRLEVLHDTEHVQHEIALEMNRCIKHLQMIFQVSTKLEAIYNVQTLFQTFISLGEMCFCLYLLSQELDENTGNEITYLFAVAFELLMYCWFGNRITEASIALSYSLYDGDWFSTNTSFKKQMIFTISRLYRPIYVTIGKITPLTFNTFLTMVRGAYSFFTFLKQRDGIRNHQSW